MKRTKVLAAFLLVIMLLAIAPIAAMAATTPVGTEQYIVGPTYVAPGGTGTYNLYEEGDVYADGNYLVENMSADPYYSYYIYWQIDALGAALAPGTTITANGVGVLTIDPSETATVINIIGYDSYYGFATSITVYIGTPPTSEESSYWLNVYTQMKAQGNNSSFTADGAENESYVPYYIVALLLNSSGRTLTIHRGLDTFVLTSAYVKGNMSNSQSHSFDSLVEMMKGNATENSRGGYTYR